MLCTKYGVDLWSIDSVISDLPSGGRLLILIFSPNFGVRLLILIFSPNWGGALINFGFLDPKPQNFRLRRSL